MKLSKLHLSPYGTFEHPEGLQSISSADARHCIRQTQTWRFRLGLTKIPVYVGHPDDPLFQNDHSDPRIYGYVKHLRADEDGLWVFVKWTKEGCRLMHRTPCRWLSPRWVLCKTENQTAYHPECLLSVGLTQHPNLPVQPIAPGELPQPSSKIRKFIQFLIKNRFFKREEHTDSTLETPCLRCCLKTSTGFPFCPFCRFFTKLKHLCLCWFRFVFIRPIQQLRNLFSTRPVGSETQTTSRFLQSKSEQSIPAKHRPHLREILRRIFGKKPSNQYRTDIGAASAFGESIFPEKVPLSSDLRGVQTREEKRRILQFGQAVRARMEATGESYPEAWNILSRQTSANSKNGTFAHGADDWRDNTPIIAKVHQALCENRSVQKYGSPPLSADAIRLCTNILSETH